MFEHDGKDAEGKRKVIQRWTPHLLDFIESGYISLDEAYAEALTQQRQRALTWTDGRVDEVG